MTDGSAPRDYSILECIETAEPLVRVGHVVHQKWTCGTCGSRQTMGEPNKFYTAGKCEECKAVTQIRECNYLLMMGALR